MSDILYIARQGDWMGKIARKFNIPDPDTIYNYPPNEELKRQRGQRDLLAPGDEVWIPVQDELEVATVGKSGGPVTITVTAAPADKLILILQNEEGDPLADKDYELSCEGLAEKITGTTGSDGRIEQELPAGTELVTIKMESKSFNFCLGQLDPPDTLSGCSSRLKNLALYSGERTDEMTSELYEALCAFQEKYELSITGRLDPETVAKMIEIYGC